MSTFSVAILASITSASDIWENFQGILAGSPPPVDFSQHPDVYEVPSHLRNIYPANNFNRDVTTTWWDTVVLDGHATEASVDVSTIFKTATFVVLDRKMYQVS